MERGTFKYGIRGKTPFKSIEPVPNKEAVFGDKPVYNPVDNCISQCEKPR
jgi:hypothetical protein